jgi:hypothetical protein
LVAAGGQDFGTGHKNGRHPGSQSSIIAVGHVQQDNCPQSRFGLADGQTLFVGFTSKEQHMRQAALFSFALAFALHSAGTAISQDRTRFPRELKRYLQMTESEVGSERIEGFKLLGRYWDSRPSEAIAGFSDLPQSNRPVNEADNHPDDQVEAIAKVIQKGLIDRNEKVREAAAIALCSAPRKLPAVLSAIETGIKSEDSAVVWYVGQRADRSMMPEMDAVIHPLLKLLASDNFNNHWTASELIGNYGTRAKPFSDRIVEIVLATDASERKLKMYLLRDTGVTDKAATRLMEGLKRLSDEEVGLAFIVLLDYPLHLQTIYKTRPAVIQSLDDNANQLYVYLCKHQLKPNETTRWLASLATLSPSAMAMLRDPKYIPQLAALERDASPHRKTFLQACKRACGDKRGKVIQVDASHPVEFRPPSAWPNSDKSRAFSVEHGDGLTYVMVTGELRLANGSHPKGVEFFGINDHMLLGSQRNDPEPVLYRPGDGRFVFYTSVFAAYAMGDKQHESGPYQTGSAQVRIEAPGCIPLTTQFFDEMPDVTIALSTKSP